MKNLVIGQSGGPTAVINASLYGAVKAFKESGTDGHVLGMINGIEGFLADHVMDLSTDLSDEELELLKLTPAASLGSCRYKLPADLESEVYPAIFDNFREMNIGYFLYVGGNDSMDTVDKLSRYAEKIGSDVKFIGIPKTIDNDLVLTDHTPGFGSAAKYVASTVREIVLDASVYQQKSVTIVEIMGRHAGWLTAASRLARAVGRQLQPERIVLVEQVVAVLHRQPRQVAVDLFEPALARLVQQGARPDEPAVELLRQPPLLGRERQRLAPVVDSLDPPEQPFVHADLVGMGRQQRHRLLLDGLHFGRRVRSGQHLEDQRRALQHPPRGIVGRDRILEGRFVRRVDDRVDLGVMERHPPLEGRQEMFGPYPVERRYAVGRRPLLEKGVGRFDLLFLTGGKRHNNKIN